MFVAVDNDSEDQVAVENQHKVDILGEARDIVGLLVAECEMEIRCSCKLSMPDA